MLGGHARHYRANVAELSQVGSMLSVVQDDLGAVSILISTSDWLRASYFRDEDGTHWDRVRGAKLIGTIYAASAAYPQMRALGRQDREHRRRFRPRRDHGGVVSSGAAAANIAMTKSWAREFASDGILVNAVFPGPTATDMLNGLGWFSVLGFAVNTLGTDLYRSELAGPLGVARPEDIADAVAFFLSRQSDQITGQTLSVTGGRALPSQAAFSPHRDA